jgi:hypothetical protein
MVATDVVLFMLSCHVGHLGWHVGIMVKGEMTQEVPGWSLPPT